MEVGWSKRLNTLTPHAQRNAALATARAAQSTPQCGTASHRRHPDGAPLSSLLQDQARGRRWPDRAGGDEPQPSPWWNRSPAAVSAWQWKDPSPHGSPMKPKKRCAVHGLPLKSTTLVARNANPSVLFVAGPNSAPVSCSVGAVRAVQSLLLCRCAAPDHHHLLLLLRWQTRPKGIVTAAAAALG